MSAASSLYRNSLALGAAHHASLSFWYWLHDRELTLAKTVGAKAGWATLSLSWKLLAIYKTTTSEFCADKVFGLSIKVLKFFDLCSDFTQLCHRRHELILEKRELSFRRYSDLKHLRRCHPEFFGVVGISDAFGDLVERFKGRNGSCASSNGIHFSPSLESRNPSVPRNGEGTMLSPDREKLSVGTENLPEEAQK
jgi:hypothetical protein